MCLDSWMVCMYGGNHVLVRTPASIALESHGHSGLSYFIWTIVSHLGYIRYVEVVLNIKGFAMRRAQHWI